MDSRAQHAPALDDLDDEPPPREDAAPARPFTVRPVPSKLSFTSPPVPPAGTGICSKLSGSKAL